MKKFSLIIALIALVFLTSCEDTTSEFTLSEAVEGLKGGLIDCASRSITKLGTSRGFYDDTLVKILLPEEAQAILNPVMNAYNGNTAVKTAVNAIGATVGFDISEFEDNFVKAMNRAASEAVKNDQTLEIFKTVVNNLSFDNAFDLLKGNVPATRAGETAVDDTPYAATIYLKRQTFDSLKSNFSPIISSVLDEPLVRSRGYDWSVNKLWKYFGDSVDAYNTAVIFLSYSTVSTPPDDLSDYIVTKALNGLFYYVGEFEKNLRENFSALFSAASAIYDAFQWASEKADTLAESTGLDVLSALPEYTF